MPQTPPPLTQSQADALVVQSVLHTQKQVGKVAQTQSDLRALWNRVFDPSDLAGSFTRLALGASYLIQQARSDAMPLLLEFYRDSKETAGYAPTTAPFAALQSLDADLAVLYATGYTAIVKALQGGASQDFAARAGEAAMLRGAQRRILDAPRQALIERTVRDPDTAAWARVGDGDPCYFCAMLISRGPVYTERTVQFRAHDGCGCGAKMCFRNDPSRGWTDQARALRTAYDENKGDWRSWYTREMKNPDSPLRFTNVTPRSDYGLAA